MAGWIPPRLRTLLGSDLDAVDAGCLERLVGVPEDADLDFKAALYAATEGEAKEAAYDVAQLANASGGLLILGVEEDGDGHARAITGAQPVEHDFGLWLHQIASARIAPNPRLVHRTVPVGSVSVHLVSVAPSILAPHLVGVGDEAFRVPMRSGNTRRWLHEAELADRYRRRFAEFSTRDAVTDRLQETGADHAPPFIADNEWSDKKWWSWLVLTLVPDAPGALELRRGVQESWLEWLQSALRDFPNPLGRELQWINLGFRSLTLSDGLGSPDVVALGGQLELDGSGVLGLGHPGGHGSVGISEARSAVFDEHLFADLVNGFTALAEHAIRCGAAGDATISARLFSRNLPMIVAQYRSSLSRGMLNGSHTAGQNTGISRHTLPLESFVTDGPERLLGPRLVGADLLSAFGLPELQQITAEFELVRNRFARDMVAAIERWSGDHGVPLVASLPSD